MLENHSIAPSLKTLLRAADDAKRWWGKNAGIYARIFTYTEHNIIIVRHNVQAMFLDEGWEEIDVYDASNAMLFFFSLSSSLAFASGPRQPSFTVINFFSLPADDECLSDDGRRIGMCMNVYECRIQGTIKPFFSPLSSICIFSSLWTHFCGRFCFLASRRDVTRRLCFGFRRLLCL